MTPSSEARCYPSLPPLREFLPPHPEGCTVRERHLPVSTKEASHLFQSFWFKASFPTGTLTFWRNPPKEQAEKDDLTLQTTNVENRISGYSSILVKSRNW